MTKNLHRLPVLKTVLAILLGLAAVTLTGCGEDTPEALDPSLHAHVLDVSALPPEVLADAMQVFDRTMTENGVSITLHQTYGDPLALHVVWSAAFPEGTDLEDLIPGAVRLENGTTSLPYSSSGNSVVRQEDNTLLCVSHFTFDKEILKPGMDIAFTVEDFTTRSSEVLFDTTQTFDLTVENKGKVKYLDIKNADGEMVGTCSLSAFALNASLWDWESLPEPELPLNTPPVKLLDQDGGVIHTKGSISGGGFNTQLTFRQAVDLDTVAAVQVGDYITQVP